MKKWRFLFITVLVMLCFTSYAFASDLARFDGRPTAFDSGSMGYFLWQDKDGMHLRITSTEISHVFSGTVRTDGNFENVFGKSQGGNDNYFHVNKNHDEITYNFTTIKDAEGIDFHINDGTYVNFKLSIDGKNINPGEIFIGKDGWHPVSNEITLQYGEYHKRDRDDRSIIIIDGGFFWHDWHDWHERGQGRGPAPHFR